MLDEYLLKMRLRSTAEGSSRVNINRVDVSPKSKFSDNSIEQKQTAYQDDNTRRLIGIPEKV